MDMKSVATLFVISDVHDKRFLPPTAKVGKFNFMRLCFKEVRSHVQSVFEEYLLGKLGEWIQFSFDDVVFGHDAVMLKSETQFE